MVKKICILGIDALEYDLVEKWNLKNLKQKEYGKVKLPVDDSNISTPTIWTSFITGKRPGEHGITTDKKWKNPFLNWFSSLKKKLVRKYGLKFLRRFNINTAIKLGAKSRPITKEDHGFDTIFEMFGNTIVISVPGYNEYEEGLEERNLFSRSRYSDRKGESKKKSLEIYEKRKKETFEKLNSKWKLFMSYFYVLDPLQHNYYYDEDFIKEMYEKVDSFVGQVRKKLDKDTLLLVIADHGQKKGMHTNYGFYSASKKLNLKNPEMTRFYSLINELLGGPSEEDEKKIKEHLKKLGYEV